MRWLHTLAALAVLIPTAGLLFAADIPTQPETPYTSGPDTYQGVKFTDGQRWPEKVDDSETERDVDYEALASFIRHDKNADGILTVDEMPPRLKDEMEMWDLNKDGAIDLSEYKRYYKARVKVPRVGPVK
jgi:hypothetical protein